MATATASPVAQAAIDLESAIGRAFDALDAIDQARIDFIRAVEACAGDGRIPASFGGAMVLGVDQFEGSGIDLSGSVYPEREPAMESVREFIELVERLTSDGGGPNGDRV
jgi:hypothetical protein